jgi:protein-S-isoprenylcysteine O-methyltransferase Ste14
MKIIRSIVYFLFTIVLYQGISLLIGWDILNLRTYFFSIERLITAIIVLIFSIAVGIQAFSNPEGIQERKGPRKMVVKRQSIIGGLITGLLLVGFIFFPWADNHNITTFPDLHYIRITGLIFLVIGYIGIYLSGVYLGKSYSSRVEIQDNQKLITNGPYRYIRHPRYTGIISLIIGYTLVYRCWVGIILFCVILFLLIVRIKDEEKMMKEEFGEEWELYRKKTKMIIPYIL